MKYFLKNRITLILIFISIINNSLGADISIKAACASSDKIVNSYVIDGGDTRKIMEFVGGGRDIYNVKIRVVSNNVKLKFTIEDVEYLFSVSATDDAECEFFVVDEGFTFFQDKVESTNECVNVGKRGQPVHCVKIN